VGVTQNLFAIHSEVDILAGVRVRASQNPLARHTRRDFATLKSDSQGMQRAGCVRHSEHFSRIPKGMCGECQRRKSAYKMDYLVSGTALVWSWMMRQPSGKRCQTNEKTPPTSPPLVRVKCQWPSSR